MTKSVSQAREHVGVGRDVLGVGDRGAVVVDADGGAVEGLELGGVRLLVARMAFPEVGAVEELEAGAGDVDGLEAVDEAEDLAGGRRCRRTRRVP